MNQDIRHSRLRQPWRRLSPLAVGAALLLAMALGRPVSARPTALSLSGIVRGAGPRLVMGESRLDGPSAAGDLDELGQRRPIGVEAAMGLDLRRVVDAALDKDGAAPALARDHGLRHQLPVVQSRALAALASAEAWG